MYIDTHIMSPGVRNHPIQEEWVLPENSMVHRQLSEKQMGRETTELFEAMVGKLTSLPRGL